jgi:hypothetical protein
MRAWFFIAAIVFWVGAMLFAGRQIFIVGPDRSGGKADRILAIGTWTLTSLLTVVVLIALGALFYKLGRHLTDRQAERLIEERRLRRSGGK